MKHIPFAAGAAFADFMTERHLMYLRRASGLPRPWTKDPVLRDHHFCNVYRELDVVTAAFRGLVRDPFAEHPNLPLMLAICRWFNNPDTIRDLIRAGAWPTAPGVFDDALIRRMCALLRGWIDSGRTIYRAAYMIRAESDTAKEWYSWPKERYVLEVVCRPVLGLPRFPTLQQTVEWLGKLYGWGGFMAYEVATDLRWSPWFGPDGPADASTYANPGPGAHRGLNRLLGEPLTKRRSVSEANALMRELLGIVTREWEGHRDRGWTGWGGSEHWPELEMREIEHSLCEYDKWRRGHEGSGVLRTYKGRT